MFFNRSDLDDFLADAHEISIPMKCWKNQPSRTKFWKFCIMHIADFSQFWPPLAQVSFVFFSGNFFLSFPKSNKNRGWDNCLFRGFKSCMLKGEILFTYQQPQALARILHWNFREVSKSPSFQVLALQFHSYPKRCSLPPPIGTRWQWEAPPGQREPVLISEDNISQLWKQPYFSLPFFQETYRKT